jgi:hypothetical protein
VRARVVEGGVLDVGAPVTVPGETRSGTNAPDRLGLELPARPPQGHVEADLLALLGRTRFGPEAWERLAPHLAFDARQYRRVRLFRDADWEGLLLCWLPGQRTAVHDHGGSIGLSFVLSGSLTERRWKTTPEGPLIEVGVSRVGRDEPALEILDTIHQVSNETLEPAVSLHVYSPPLRALGAHDPADGRRWEVPVADSPDVQVGGNPVLLS